MRRALLIGACLIGLTGPAAAQDFGQCTKAERGTATAAIRNAKALALAASVSVGETAAYGRWFGKYEPTYSEHVRATLKAVFVALRSGRVSVDCPGVSPDACERDTFAYVYDDEPLLIYLCPKFFEMQSMARMQPGTRASDDGTKEGTIIHEISHFIAVGGTLDHCYGRQECEAMARSDPAAAVRNADSYQYFAEDISFENRSTEVLGKPAD